MGLLPIGTMNRSASSLQSRIKGFGLPVRSTHLPTITSGSLGTKNKCSTRPQGICYNRNGSFLVGSAALALGLSSATWTYSPDFGKVGERRYFWKWARGKAVRCEEREKGKKDEKVNCPRQVQSSPKDTAQRTVYLPGRMGYECRR